MSHNTITKLAEFRDVLVENELDDKGAIFECLSEQRVPSPFKHFYIMAATDFSQPDDYGELEK